MPENSLEGGRHEGDAPCAGDDFDPDMSFVVDPGSDDCDEEGCPLPVLDLPGLDARSYNPMDASDRSEKGAGTSGLEPLRSVRERDLALSATMTEMYRKRERDSLERLGLSTWDIEDSRLDGSDTSFEAWFAGLLPQGEGLRSYVERILQSQDPRLGIELGGGGMAVFGGFSDGFFDETAGVTLVDTRGYVPGSDLPADKVGSVNHKVIEGNVLDSDTKDAVDEWLDGRKLNLVLERMYGGISGLPSDPFTLAKNANHWYERLAEGGLMLLQVPHGLKSYVDEWKCLVEAEGYGLDIQTGEFEGRGVLRLHKLHGAPASLPLISARTLMERRNATRNLRATRGSCN